MKTFKLNKKLKNNIAIIGHMGAGKSVIGKMIAKKFNLTHIDSDKLIEKHTKKTINDIFEIEGEINFRIIEENIILGLTQLENTVLSLGGGAIMKKKVRNFLKSNFTTLFLDVDIPILIKRLEHSTKRPLLLNIDIGKKIKELDIIRRKYYLLADIKLKSNENAFNTLNNFELKYKKFHE